MATLVIHAPDHRVKQGAKSFEAVMEDGIGVRYAIYEQYISILNPGCTVVLLRKDKRRKRGEGRLTQLKPTGIFTHNGIQRYDVYFENRKLVPYKPEKLNRCGVAVLCSGNDC